ncbi:MAG: helix-turn-helix transcriptional regulator [Bacteroidaceae bacterium]|nr:helix-turn-helix transcriptional regulator [Bacteroidaceae bacterium]
MRKSLGMSQGQFADKIGCGQTNVSFLEKNLCTTSESTYKALVRAFGEDFVKTFEESEPSSIIKGRTAATGKQEVITAELLHILREQQRQTADTINLLRQTVSAITEMLERQGYRSNPS